MTSISPFEAVIFDLDGTLFRGSTAIPGAVKAVNRLREQIPCRFLSNNGERQSKALADRLQGLGFDAEDSDIVSSADLVLGYLARTGRTHRILALASDNLVQGLKAQGHRVVDDDSANVVIVGVDRKLTRERMVQALRAALNGAVLIGTNQDPTYPGEDGLRPAAGAYVGFFRGMGIEPACLCGKPDAWAIRQALDAWNIDEPESCLLVGDNLQTDIAGAAAVGAASVLVLSGVSQREALATSPNRPTGVFDSVAALDFAALCELSEAHRNVPAASEAKPLTSGGDRS